MCGSVGGCFRRSICDDATATEAHHREGRASISCPRCCGGCGGCQRNVSGRRSLSQHAWAHPNAFDGCNEPASAHDPNEPASARALTHATCSADTTGTRRLTKMRRQGRGRERGGGMAYASVASGGVRLRGVRCRIAMGTRSRDHWTHCHVRPNDQPAQCARTKRWR